MELQMTLDSKDDCISNEQGERDVSWMQKALVLAEKAGRQGEVPVGALIVDANNKLVSEGWNQPITCVDPTHHAEISAIRNAAKKIGNYRLVDCTMYVTVEPCSMCVGAIIHSRIARLVIATPEPKAGCVVSQIKLLDAEWFNHRVAYQVGVCAEQAGQLMSDFFSRRRQDKKKK
ncbi:tRNA adenosine(34) deaminase TadA [Aurantivibrio infirmus]